ncbi:forkhead box protein B2-like, partial [Pantherophis guttatus]|uniref:Forkhead box protein B2-like n=1 Tax=Pantherophis guttatus TaxID=94885 RepID=A0ABM3ZNS0_PANGU
HYPSSSSHYPSSSSHYPSSSSHYPSPSPHYPSSSSHYPSSSSSSSSHYPSSPPPPPPPPSPSHHPPSLRPPATKHISPGVPTVSTNIALDPEKPEIGGHVTLIPSGDTNTLSTCSWFRGGDDEAKPIVTYSLPPLSKLAFKDGSTGREFLNSDCSLHIKNLTTQDEGFYKGVMEKNEGKSVGKVYLRLQGLTGRKGNRLSTPGIIGIAVSSFFVVSMLVGLTAYQIVTSRSSISQPAPTTSAAAVAPVAAPAPAPAPIPASTQVAKKTTAPKRKTTRGGTAQRGVRGRGRGRGGARGAPRRGR